MDAETRAALEWATRLALGFSNVVMPANAAVRLQALLDEKGGGVRETQREPGVAGVRSATLGSDVPSPVSTHEPPPDSAAKIAAEMRDLVAERYVLDRLMAWAARVEALGLEPSEREVVRNVVVEASAFASGVVVIDETDAVLDGRHLARQWVAALAPIAEKRP